MSLRVRFDLRRAVDLADVLQQITGKRIGVEAVEAVNEVTTRFEQRAVDEGLRDINLTAAYYRSKTDVALASNPLKPRAEILARGDLTVMGRFQGTYWYPSNNRVVRRAGLVKGRRSAGAVLAVRRSVTQNEPQVFLMKLRGQGGLAGAFIRDDSIAPKNRRDGKAGKRHLYGPSPYQLFRRSVTVGAAELQRDLESTAVRRITRVIDL